MSLTYDGRGGGFPVLWGRNTRSHSRTFLEGSRTLTEYLSLYKRGEVGPLRYEFHGVPIAPCRECGNYRLDDGTPCLFCGAYQRHATINPDDGVGDVEVTPSASPPPGVSKRVNPRRSIRNGR